MGRYGAEAVVLRFPLPRLQREQHASARWVLWPASAWRVVAPRPRRRAMNVFQRAILGLCLAGVTRVEDIGRRLLIAEALAEHIQGELRGIGWLGPREEVTTAGRRVLEDDATEPIEDFVVGWVFTDPFTGLVWPRFHPGELPYAEVDPGEGSRRVLLSGSRGAPHRDHAFEVKAHWQDEVRVVRPTAEEILRAARSHRRQHDREDEPVTGDPPVLQRVSLVLEEPVSCLLATRAWLAAPGDWRVDDPFGVGQSLRLRGLIETRMALDRPLRDWLEPIAGGSPDAGDIASLEQHAKWLVKDRLTATDRIRPELYERLVAMQRALLETEQENAPEDKWDDVAVKAQRAAERAFLDVHDAHPARAPLANDEAFNEALLDELARTAGFVVPLPQSLSRVRRGKVTHAMEHGSGSLRALILVGLLGSAGSPGHPLTHAAKGDARLLHRLDELATTRDRSAHEGTGERLSSRREWVRSGVDTVFDAVRLLFST